MQTRKQDSTRPSPATPSSVTPDPAWTTLAASALSAPFMELARHRGEEAGLADSRLARLARATGPWDVEALPAGSGTVHAVVRRAEPMAEGGAACLVTRRRQDALLGAATLAAMAIPSHLAINQSTAHGRLGHALHDGRDHLGHLAPSLAREGEAFLAYHHAVRCLAVHPEAVGLLLEALDSETLGLLGRAAMRRMG